MADSYQYLTEENILELFKTSKQHTDALTVRFREYERLMRNQPSATVPDEMPKVTDGTGASIVRKTPHRSIQQIPTGKVNSDGPEWLEVIGDFIFTHKIIPKANEGYALLQKCWNITERFLGFGFGASYAPFVQNQGEFTTDCRLVYWGDIYLQPGKISDSDSNYVFVRSWWQTSDIDKLIANQKKLPKGTETTWDTDALAVAKTHVVEKDEKGKTPAEKELNINQSGGIQLITGFQRGTGAVIMTFSPDAEKIVRRKKNKDPRGELNVQFAYGDIDGSNPFGRSIFEMIGSLQNLLDTEVQLYQFNRALQLGPVILKYGSFNKEKIKLIPNHIIDMGTDPTNKIDTLKIDSTALQQFANNYGLIKSQMLNLVSSPDTSISAEVGNPGFSKTDAGVKATNATISVDDNYVRKQFETWFERWGETALNLYFAERSGVEELQLDDATANKLKKLAEDNKFDIGNLSEDNHVRISYDDFTEAFHFTIDPTSSKVQTETQQLQSLTGLVNLLDTSPLLQKVVPIDKQMNLWNDLVDNSGVQDPEDLKVTEAQIKAAMQPMMPPAIDPETGQPIPPEAGQPGMEIAPQPGPLPQPPSAGLPIPPGISVGGAVHG